MVLTVHLDCREEEVTKEKRYGYNYIITAISRLRNSETEMKNGVASKNKHVANYI